MNKVEDFTDHELSVVQHVIDGRWSEEKVEPQLADVEGVAPGEHGEPIMMPAVIWVVADCTYVIVKSGEKSFAAQFFFEVNKQYRVGEGGFSDLYTCATSLLQMQADYQRKRDEAENADNQ